MTDEDRGKIRSCHRKISRKGTPREERDSTFKNRNKKGSKGTGGNKRQMRQDC